MKRTEICSWCKKTMRISGNLKLIGICKCGSAVDFSSRMEDILYGDLS